MNKTSQVLTLTAALVAAAAVTTHAQTWVNVLDPSHGGIAGSSSDLCTDAAGNIFAAGSTTQTTDGNMRAVVVGSGDHGATWTVLDQYAEAGLNYAHNRAVAADSLTGSLFAGGNLNNLLPNGTYEFGTLWFIREWNPTTGVWTKVDDSADLANDIGQASCADILVSPARSLSDLRVRTKCDAPRFDLAHSDFRRRCFDGPKQSFLIKNSLSPTGC